MWLGRLQPWIGKAGLCSISRALYFASLCPVLDPNGFSGCSAAAAQVTNFMEFVSLSWRKDTGGYQALEVEPGRYAFDNA
jgi:hypothetical protein